MHAPITFVIAVGINTGYFFDTKNGTFGILAPNKVRTARIVVSDVIVSQGRCEFFGINLGIHVAAVEDKNEMFLSIQCNMSASNSSRVVGVDGRYETIFFGDCSEARR